MKKYTTLFILFLIVGCSQFEDDFEIPSAPISFTEIETDHPVINIIADQDDFDKMYGSHDEEIEIEGLFNLYRNQELIIENEEIEIEIKGGHSTRFSLKSLGIKFEDKYDNSDRSLINSEQVLPYHSIDKIKAIRLRNSGNDFKYTMIKDVSLTQLAIRAGLDLEVTYDEPSLVYVNGDFYGLLNIRTEGNANGVAGLYGAKKDDITLAKITRHGLIKKDGDFARIDALVDAIDRKDIAYLKNEIDLSNFIDYMVFESYVGNTDWPHNNSRFYAIDGGKFRFILFDLDRAIWFNLNKSPLEIIENKGESSVLTDLFFALYEDETFKQTFWERYNSLMDSGAISFENFKSIVQSNVLRIATEVPMQIRKHNSPETMIEWNIEIEKMLGLFKEREVIVREFLAE